jgi:RimJ/RimL family protein N-acetyltransferase
MAQGLVERAIAAPEVHRIRAHTLPEPNASTRILEKLGFLKSGDAMDPDAGPVWRWERAATP